MRKYITIFVSVFVLCFCLCNISVSAKNKYGFQTINLSKEEKGKILKNCDIQKINISSLDEINSTLVSFDVLENEKLVLGFKNETILIIDKNKKVLNAYKFPCDGDFYVCWQNENVLIQIVRGSILLEISQDGQPVSVERADDTSSENNDLWNKISEKHFVELKNATYLAKNEMGFLNYFTSSYAQLIKSDANGKETVIFDINKSQLTKNIITIIFIVSFVCLVFVILLKSTKAKTKYEPKS